MAKTATPKNDNKPANSGVLNPQPKDPKMELFYMLGVLRGANVDGAIRIAELVNLILDPGEAPETGAAE